MCAIWSVDKVHCDFIVTFTLTTLHIPGTNCAEQLIVGFCWLKQFPSSWFAFRFRNVLKVSLLNAMWRTFVIVGGLVLMLLLTSAESQSSNSDLEFIRVKVLFLQHFSAMFVIRMDQTYSGAMILNQVIWLPVQKTSAGWRCAKMLTKVRWQNKNLSVIFNSYLF